MLILRNGVKKAATARRPLQRLASLSVLEDMAMAESTTSKIDPHNELNFADGC